MRRIAIGKPSRELTTAEVQLADDFAKAVHPEYVSRHWCWDDGVPDPEMISKMVQGLMLHQLSRLGPRFREALGASGPIRSGGILVHSWRGKTWLLAFCPVEGHLSAGGKPHAYSCPTGGKK